MAVLLLLFAGVSNKPVKFGKVVLLPLQASRMQSYLSLLVVLAGIQVARSDSNECMPEGHASSVTTKHHHQPKPYTSWAAEQLLSAKSFNAIDCSKLVPQNRGKYWVSAKLEPGGSLSSLVK